MIKALFLTALCLACSPLGGFAGPPDSTPARLELLEKRLDNLEKNNEAKTALQAEALSVQAESLRTDLKKLENEVWYNSWLAVAIWFTALFAAVGGAIAFFRREVESRVQARIANMVEDNRGKILALIGQHDLEAQLRQEKKVLVLSKPDATVDFLQQTVQQQFPQTDFQTTEPNGTGGFAFGGLTRRFGQYDALLFNSYETGKDYSEAEINVLLAACASVTNHKTILFYFGMGRVEAESLKQRFSSANMKPQLLANLLNAFKYQHLLESRA